MDNLLKARVEELCRKKGITVNKLENDLPIISQGTIKGWDRHMPSIDRIAAVADYFGVTIDYLCGYEGRYEKDIQKLIDIATWLTKEDLVALIVIAEQLKKGKA